MQKHDLRITFILLFAFVLWGNVDSFAQSNERETIEKYLLKGKNLSIAEAEASFEIGQYRNVEALSVLKWIKNAEEMPSAASVCEKTSQILLKKPEFGPLAMRNQYSILQEQLEAIGREGGTLEYKKAKTAYNVSYFLHFYYLYNAKNSVLELNPNYGRSVYTDLVSGKVPAELRTEKPEESSEASPLDRVISGETELTETAQDFWDSLKDYLPFGHYGLIPLLLIVFGSLYRFLRPRQTVQQDSSPHNAGTNKGSGSTIDVLTAVGTNGAKVQEDPPTSSGSEATTAPEESVEELVMVQELINFVERQLYAQAPHGNIFNKVNEKHIRYYTPFTLKIDPNNPLEASIELTTDEEELKSIIDTNLKMLEDTCEFPTDKKIYSPKDIAVEKPGRAVRFGEHWQIKEKIRLV
jgi:hypothetical protein